ncbi:MAG: hypothetical protein ACKVQB_11480 [Bacteroidia bacterium]
MNPTRFSFLIFLLISSGLFAQSISLRKVTTLPSIVQETSGIETSNLLYIWTHNDSDSDPALYKIDTLGNLLKTVFFKNTTNVDWEDVTSDGQNYYIADIGNNDNTRKNLKIYKIPNPDNVTADSISAEIISFNYPNQTKFPPDNARLNFDAEALMYFNSSLYIFTKNRTSPFTGYTYLFKLPDEPGQHTATLLDSFKTGSGIKEQWWITAADMSPDLKKVALLSSDKIFVFTDFAGDNFFKGKVKTIDLGSFTQKEGLAFYTNTEFYITDEYFDLLGGRNLYQGSIKNLYSASFKDTNKFQNLLINYKKQFGEPTISLIDETKKVNVSVMDMNGKVVAIYQMDYTQPIAIIDVVAGYYTLLNTDGKVKQEMKILID